MKPSIIKFNDWDYIMYRATITLNHSEVSISCATEKEMWTVIKRILPKRRPVHIIMDILDYKWLIRKLKRKFDVTVITH